MGAEAEQHDIGELVSACGTGPEALIPALRAIQKRLNYIPPTALQQLPGLIDVSPSRLTAVVTFYRQFRLHPAGSHFIKVCIGTACHVKGAEDVFEAFKKTLGIPADGDTDAAGLFTVEKVACLGCCMLAPAVQIDEVTYGHVSPAGTGEVVRDFLASQVSRGGVLGTSATPAASAGDALLCECSSCAAAGAGAVATAIRSASKRFGLGVTYHSVGCTGVSFEAPLLELRVNGEVFRYSRVAPADVDAILLRHFRAATPSARLRAALGTTLRALYEVDDPSPVVRYSLQGSPGMAAYNSSQAPRALRHAGETAPLDLAAYRRDGGFEALSQCVCPTGPERVIEALRDYGLRGRGGGGYPTWRKWRAVRDALGPKKYVICNADEGDPGAFMDRMILESFPFRVLEGIAVAGLTVGADAGIVYVRSEYPLAVERMRRAVAACLAEGIVGENIGGTGRTFQVAVREGAGAFVCGEETALIASLEGRRGMPHVRPPYPSEHGLHGCPTLINNVETFATVPWILRHAAGAERVGTDSSRGTKVFALAGKITRGGLIEVPMGMTLRDIVDRIGGGIQNGRQLKAVQVGGPSGGCVPASLCDTPVDFEALSRAGAMMGSGGMVVLDDEDCMVDVARYFMSFTQAESCGKCTFCRVGTKRMLEILTRLCEGQGTQDDVEQLAAIGKMTQEGSLCGLGRTAPNPVLSTLRFFADEYAAHAEGRCPAGKCKKLITYRITDDCIGCTRCAQHCPAAAIVSRPYEVHEIDPSACVRCDACRQACPADAIRVE